MANTVDQIVEQLKTLTLMEATELVKQIEETFDVDASAPVGAAVMAPMPGQGGEAVAEEKTTFDVTIDDVASDKRVPVLKVIRKLTGVGLADAKAFTTSLPKLLQESIPKEEAEAAKVALEEAGAKVTIS